MASRLIFFLTFLILTGCAVAPERLEPRITKPGDGAVVMRILPNMEGASQFFKNWQDVIVERVAGMGESGQKYSVSPFMQGSSRSAIYASALPAGEYRLVAFSAGACGYMCTHSSVTLDPTFSRFEIKSGTLTDLGPLVQMGSPFDAKKVLVAHNTVPDRAASDRILRELLPDLSSLLTGPVLSWKAATVPASMAETFAFTRKNSFGFVSPQETSSGSFVYGSANGVVYSWQPGARPVAHDIGVRGSVETILVTSEGQWLAGGELGMLLSSSDNGASWRPLGDTLPLGLIVSLRQWRKQVIVTSLSANQVLVHSAPLGSTTWQKLASYDMDVPLFWTVPGTQRPQSFLLDDKLLTTVPGRMVATLDLVSGKSALDAAPGTIQMLSVSVDGVLRCRCLSVIKVDPYESHDLGKTWKSSTAPRFMTMPTFKNKLHGVGFKTGFISGGKMLYTKDGGESWIETTEVPTAFNELFYSKDGSTAYAASPYGLWHSRDDGVSWQEMRR